MSWNQTLTNLRDLLASLYMTVEDSLVIVEEAQLNPAHIALDKKAITNWHNILREADKRNKVQAIIDVARQDYPDNDWLFYAEQGSLSAVRGPDIDEGIAWAGSLDSDQLEKIMGKQSTLLPISFLEIGLEKARAVARIVLPSGDTGSGFLIHDNFLVTNHHVLPSDAMAQESIVQFNYQRTAAGHDAAVEAYRLAPDSFFATSPKNEDDWTVVKVEGDANAKWGALDLNQAGTEVQERVNIIQHPGGGPKQIAMYNNIVVFVGQNRIQYLTDTLPGSSGSPVFDQNWRVVAVHHSGGWIREPGSKQQYYRNEGVHVHAVVQGLK